MANVRAARRALAAALLAALLACAIASSAPARPAAAEAAAGLVAAYSFNDGSGPSAADASGNGRTGGVSGATWVTTGKFAGGLSFDGVNDLVTVADAAPLDLTTGMTLEAWVKPTVLSGSWRTAIIKEQTGQLVYALYANATTTSRPSAHVFVGGDKTTSGGAALPLNAWTHLAATYDGAALRLYVNGAQATSLAQSGSMPASAQPLQIGGNAVWSEWFAGTIDEVRIYNRALSTAELQTDMNTPVDSQAPSTPTGLVQTGSSSTSVSFAWNASTDNVGVTGYGLYRNGASAGSATSTNATLSGLACGTTSNVGVDAVDAAGNRSGTTTIPMSTAPCDSQAPSTPTGLVQTGSTESTVSLSWNASTDNVAVASYSLFRDGVPAGSVATTSGTVGGLTCGATPLIGVEAVDGAGNHSGRATLSSTTSPCDGTPPTVSITAPAAASTVSGAGVLVTANAADNTAVAGVQFKVDGGNLGLEDTVAPYSVTWDTRTSANGGHSLTAVARDSSNNLTTSAAVAVTVDNDVTAPTVSLTAPAAGATVSGTVTVSANAADDRAVAGVQFKVDGVPTGAEDTVAPYSIAWNSVGAADGAHTLTAVARDAAGNATPSQARTVTVSNGLNTGDAFKLVAVGPGYVHASTREVVRTSGGRVYIFAADDTAQRQGTGPGTIHAWKADQPGIPTSFTEVDAANRPIGPAGTTNVVGSPDVRLDRAGIVHRIYTREADASVVYRTFSTVTDSWGATEVIATGVPVPYSTTFHKRNTSNAIILDANDVPHVVYIAGTSVVYRNRVGGTWSAPVTLATVPAGKPSHCQLAMDNLGNMHLVWLVDGISSPRVEYQRRAPNGTWSPTEIVADVDVQGNDSEDQGPSVVVNQAGTPYVLRIGALDPQGSCCSSGVKVRYRSGSTWITDNPSQNVFTHAPQIYSRGNDIYVFLGHDLGTEYGYVYHLAGQSWANAIRLTSGWTLDGSASVRWDPQRETNANVIDTSLYDEDLFDDKRYIPRLYYMAILPSGAPAPDTTPPTTPGSLAQTGATATSVSVQWTASTDNVGVSGYGLYLDGGFTGTTTATTATFGSLPCGTPHTVEVDAFDAAGNRSTRAAANVATAACDTVAPTVFVTSPPGGATVSGVVNVTADASDAGGVAGVQFKLDGANLGAEDTGFPYGVSWSSATASNGQHTLTAVARDAAGNQATSAPVTVTVSNGQAPLAFVKTLGTATAATSGTTVALTVPAGGVAVGRTVVVWTGMSSRTLNLTSITDSRGNAYTVDLSVKHASSSVSNFIGSARIATALQAGDQITVGFSGSSSIRLVAAAEFSGVASASRVDRTAGTNGTSTTPSSPTTAATSQPAELVVGGFGANASSSVGFTPAAPFTALTAASATAGTTSRSIYREFQIVGATGAYRANGTLTSNTQWTAGIVTYRGGP
jgi:chitodextrinase